MFSELPLEWQQKLTEELAFVRKNGFYLTNPAQIQKQPKTLSVLLQPTKEYRRKLFEFVRDAVPAELRSKIILQPYEGYHVSVQWSKEFTNTKVAIFCKNIDKVAKTLPLVKTHVFGLYPSDNNFFFVLKTDVNVSEIRSQVSKVMEQNNAIPKLPGNLSIIWMSVARIVKPFTKEEIELSISKLGKKQFIDMYLSQLVVAKSDPFFDRKHSEILFEQTLVANC